MRKRLTLALVALLTAVLGIAAVACEGTVSFTTANITNIVMAKAVDAEKKPVNPTSVFGTGTSEVFCSAKMNSAPEGTKVTGKWIYVSGELKDVTNYEIDSATLEIGGTAYFSMSLSRPTNGWPKGDYKLALAIDGKEAGSASFTIQ